MVARGLRRPGDHVRGAQRKEIGLDACYRHLSLHTILLQTNVAGIRLKCQLPGYHVCLSLLQSLLLCPTPARRISAYVQFVSFLGKGTLSPTPPFPPSLPMS